MTSEDKSMQLSSWRAIALAPYAWIGLVLLFAAAFAFPQTDDFCTFARLYGNSDGNPLREAWYLYMNWSGRYSASFVVAATGWLASVIPLPLQWVYAAVLMVLVALFAFACVRVSRLVNIGQVANVPLAALMFAAALVLMPSKLEGITWLTGVGVYSVGIATLLLLFESVARDDQASNEGRSTYSFRSLGLIFVSVGFNEFIGLAIGGFLILRILFFARGFGYAKQNLAYFATYLVTFTATLLAPGNFVRDATISTPRHNLPAAIDLSTTSGLSFIGTHVLPNFALLVSLVVAAFTAGWLVRHPGGPRALRNLLPVALALILSFPLHFLVFAYLTGELLPGRVINQAYAMALVGALLLAAWLGSWFAARDQRGMPRLGLAIIFAVGILLLAGPQFRDLSTVTRDFGPIWRQQQIQRHHQLLAMAANGVTAARVQRFSREKSGSPILQGTDMTDDGSYWVNRCVADFYGVESITPRD